MNQSVKNWLKSPAAIPLALIAIVVVYFWGMCDVYSVLHNRESEVFQWMMDSWNERNDLLHGFAVPFLFVAFCFKAAKVMMKEAPSKGGVGLVILAFGMLLFVASARTIQPRLALVGLPFLISGSVIYCCGWKAGRHMLFPAFFWYFAMPVPGLNQMTNVLQVLVTGACYQVGVFSGMELVKSGNNIYSATEAWDFNIAEGCSGIRSLMALVMIAAIFAYYTQKELWKKIVVFGASLPLALIGNFFRVFTILILAELGYDDFAANSYHDFSGLLLFFPAALVGLLLLDRVLNPSKYKKKVKITQRGETNEE